jgi:hypothetical protein
VDSQIEYEDWLKSELGNGGYTLELPPKPTPGAIAVLVPTSQHEAFKKATDATQVKVWEVRGILAQPMSQFYAASFLRSTDGTLVSTIGTMSVGGAATFRLRSDGTGNVSEICARVEETTPVRALGRARQPFEELLDEIVSYAFLPIRYSHFDVASTKDSPTLAREVFLPFGPAVQIDGNEHLPPVLGWLGVLNELFREGLCSSSPYYRLLCAFRLVEGIFRFRKEIVAGCRVRGIKATPPKWLCILKSEILERGATIDRKLTKKGERLSLPELYEAWHDKRNAVAHLFFRENKTRFLILSNSIDYRDFACSAAILLLYARKTVQELLSFVREHLRPFPVAITIPCVFGEADMLGVIRQSRTRYEEWSDRT